MLHVAVLSIHIFTVVFLISVVLLADSLGMKWLRGKVEILDKKRIEKYHKIITYGLGVVIITGANLFWPYQAYLLTLPTFWVKISFIIVLIINGLFIGKLMHKATEQSFASLQPREKKLILLSGNVSTISWIAIIVAAFNLGL